MPLAISTLDPIRSQVVGDVHQASQLLETPAAERGVGSMRAPAYNNPQVRSLHQQHDTMVALQELRSRNQSQSQNPSVNDPASTPGESHQASTSGPTAEQANATYLGGEHRCSICLEEYV